MTFRIFDTPLARPEPLATAPDWYPAPPSGSDAWGARCRQIGGSSGNWLTPIRAAFGSGAALLDRVANGNGVVVTTGQQPGLFGGPLYTWHKALAALELAAHIERTTGIPAAPVFWAATDDADFAEAAFTVVNTGNGAQRIALSMRPPDGVPMSLAAIGAESTVLYDALRAASGESADAAPLRAAASFREHATIGGAYVEMLRALLEPLGIPVLDASHESIAAASRVHMHGALFGAAAIHDALVVQRDALRAAGRAVPVDLDRELSLVFSWDQGSDGLARKRRLTIDEAVGAVSASSRLSPNVLLRPVIERMLLPTIAYLGGPGEMAYFAQVSVVARAMNAPVPLALPRWSGTIVPADIDAALERLQLTIDDLRDPHAAEARVAGATLPADVTVALAELSTSIESNLARLVHALPGPTLDGARGQFGHRIARLERRLLASAKHRSAASMRLVARTRGALFPLGKPQERALNMVPFWCAHGDALIASIRAACAAHAAALVK